MSAALALALLTIGVPAALAAEGAVPTIDGKSTMLPTTESATIEAQINPHGLKTKYEIWLEYEQQSDSGYHEALPGGPEYNSGTIAAGSIDETVNSGVFALIPGHSYSYSIVATNSAGSARSGGVIEDCPSAGSCPAPLPEPGACAEGCPGSGGKPYVPVLSKEAIEGEMKWGAGAPAREAQRQAEVKAAEERTTHEAAERAAQAREAHEAQERTIREAEARGLEKGLAMAVRCQVPNLRGDSLAVARTRLRHQHCRLGKVRRLRKGRGTLVIVNQGTPVGRRLRAGASVAVALGRGGRSAGRHS